MLRANINRCEIAFQFKTATPMLVKDGRYEQNKAKRPGAPPDDGPPAGVFQCREAEDVMHRRVRDKQFDQLTFFVPGSTIRGVFRSHLESAIRSVSPDAPIVCNPFVSVPAADKMPLQPTYFEPGCGFTASEETPYAESCPVCRIFGSTKHAGRITFEDGNELPQGRTIEFSDQIQIDRFTGSVGEGPFRWMLLRNATFETRISLRNFELWQLGLLAYAFQDLRDSLIQMGMGKNIDRGRIHSDPNAAKVKLTYTNGDGALKGLYEAIMDAGNKYRFVPRNDRNGIPGMLNLVGQGDLWRTYEPRSVEEFWTVLKPTWNDALKANIFTGRGRTYPEA